MLTELDRSVIIAVSCGFVGGLSQAILDYFLSIKLDKQIRSFKDSIAIGSFFGICMGIIMGVMTSVEFSWDINISLTEINRDNILMGFLLLLIPFLNRLFLYLSSSKKTT
ncbi:MAG: hypothetical protein AB4368_28660 [Xenococcaceae cyanobacterium]